MSIAIKTGEMIRVCKNNSCGEVFSNHLSSCPKCGADYNVKVAERDMYLDI